jgi:hypothetical protein
LKKFKPVQIEADLQEHFKIACANEGFFMGEILNAIINKWMMEVGYDKTRRAPAKMEQS